MPVKPTPQITADVVEANVLATVGTFAPGGAHGTIQLHAGDGDGITVYSGKDDPSVSQPNAGAYLRRIDATHVEFWSTPRPAGRRSRRPANRAMPPQPITAICSRKFRAVKTQGKRAPGNVLWIVLHDEEASTAESAARFFTLPQAGGSAHLCVDDAICYRTLDNDDIAEGAPGANTHGFHIEQAGFAKWSVTTWLLHRQTLRRAAYKTAVHCRLFGIPPVFVFAAQLRETHPGITTHREVSKAFGGDHSDPGPFWPRRLFMRFVHEYHAALDT